MTFSPYGSAIPLVLAG